MSNSSDKQDPVVEARELLSKATLEPLKLIRYEHGCGRLWREDTRDLIADFYDEGNREFYARSRDIVSSLCNELEQVRSQHSVQVDSIKALHEQEKVMRAAIEGLISTADFALSTPGFVRGRDQLKNAIESAHAAITPKGEQK